MTGVPAAAGVNGCDYPWFDLATRTFQASVKGDHDAAGALLAELAVRFPDDMPKILLTWIDTTIDAAKGEVEYGPGKRVVALNAETGSLDGMDLTDAQGWVNAAVAARLNDDVAGYTALIDASDDPKVWTDRVVACLQSCGMTTRLAMLAGRQS